MKIYVYIAMPLLCFVQPAYAWNDKPNLIPSKPGREQALEAFVCPPNLTKIEIGGDPTRHYFCTDDLGKKVGVEKIVSFDGNLVGEIQHDNTGSYAKTWRADGVLLEEGKKGPEGKRLGPWKFYWPNGNLKSVEHYESLTPNSKTTTITNIVLFSERGNIVERDILPLDCIPQLENRSCDLSEFGSGELTMVATRMGIMGAGATVESENWFTTGSVLDVFQKIATKDGKVVAYSGLTPTMALLITEPRRVAGGTIDEYYRFRLLRDVCREEKSTCKVRLTANLVKVPVVNGKRDNSAKRFLNDPLVGRVVEAVRNTVRAVRRERHTIIS